MSHSLKGYRRGLKWPRSKNRKIKCQLGCLTLASNFSHAFNFTNFLTQFLTISEGLSFHWAFSGTSSARGCYLNAIRVPTDVVLAPMESAVEADHHWVEDPRSVLSWTNSSLKRGSELSKTAQTCTNAVSSSRSTLPALFLCKKLHQAARADGLVLIIAWEFLPHFWRGNHHECVCCALIDENCQ